MKKIICWFFDHQWQVYDKTNPYSTYKDCERCEMLWMDYCQYKGLNP